MYIATGIAAAFVVAAAGGGLLLSAVSTSDDDGTVGPAAEAPVVGDDWTFFRGTVRLDGSRVQPVETYSESGMAIEYIGGWEGQTMEADDPRMTGTRTDISTVWTGQHEGNPAYLFTGRVMLENDEGGWTCATSGVDIEGSTGGSGDVSSENGWCDGHGEYAGLRAFVAFDWRDAGMFTVHDFWGYITSRDGPAPIPEEAVPTE